MSDENGHRPRRAQADFVKHLGTRKKIDPRAYMLEEGHDRPRSPDSIAQDWFNGVFIGDWGKLRILVDAILRDPALRAP
jgi:hypothetical protein